MAVFKCPHCGEEVVVKVLLKDVTPQKNDGDDDANDIVKTITSAVVQAIERKEHPDTVSRLSKRVPTGDPLTNMFANMHDELMSKREQLQKEGQLTVRERFDSEGDTYLSDDKISNGEDVANRLKNMFGG